MKLKNKKGVSMITVIITIVVVIILTSIAMQTTSDVPDQANLVKYKQEMKNVQTGVENQKVKNAAKGNTEAKLTAGFEKVYLDNAPAEFVSFGDYYEDVRGYLVRLDKIGYTEAEYGQGYVNYESGDRLVFGEKEYDVFVFDADWKVFYIKGLKYDGSMNYFLD